MGTRFRFTRHPLTLNSSYQLRLRYNSSPILFQTQMRVLCHLGRLNKGPPLLRRRSSNQNSATTLTHRQMRCFRIASYSFDDIKMTLCNHLEKCCNRKPRSRSSRLCQRFSSSKETSFRRLLSKRVSMQPQPLRL